jgi:glyoxylase-like metal-dependent hydrolase (beta-lactamase superfamily II)
VETRDLTDGERTVQLRQIPNPHAKGMLAAYLPGERVVFVTDLYTPGTPVQPGNPNAHAFYTALKEANLAVDRVVGGHGAIGTFRELALVDTPVRTGS